MRGLVGYLEFRRPGRHFWSTLLAAGSLILIIVALAFQGAGAEEPSNEHFEERWARTDYPVANGNVSRTWMWSPEAFTGELTEPYAQSPNGERQVQYFDKARMEITYPDADVDSLWYVTNGLLVNELINGHIQVGDNEFEPSVPADVPVAGDPDDTLGPTYATFTDLLDAEPAAEGSVYQTRLSRDGTLTVDQALGEYNIQAAVLDEETNHRIAQPFWDLMNATGTVYEDGQFIEGPLFRNQIYATGRPVTEAYWASSKVDGVVKDVLVQCFERRCMTYTPSNEATWQVEAGNVGLHYYHWRYDTNVAPPATEPPTEPPTETEEPAEGVSVVVNAMVDCDNDGQVDGDAVPVGEVGPCGPLTGGEVTTVSNGAPGSANELQAITMTNAIGGTFNLTFFHPTAGPILITSIPYDVPAGELGVTISNAFAAEGVGLDAPTATGGPLNGLDEDSEILDCDEEDATCIEFLFDNGNLLGQNVPQVQIATFFTFPEEEEPIDSEAVTLVNGGGDAEVQTISPNSATGGTFDISIQHPTAGAISVTIPFNATSAQAETLIRQAFDEKEVAADAPEVIGGPANTNDLTIQFVNGAMAGVNIDQIVINNDDLTTTAESSEVLVLDDENDVVETWLVDENGQATGELPAGESFNFQLHYREDSGQNGNVFSGLTEITDPMDEIDLTVILLYPSAD